MRRGGPNLPYELLGGVQPCSGGWLVVSAKLQGVTLAGPVADVHPTFLDVLDHRPSFSVVALNLPLGLSDRASKGGRACDRAARQLLGRPRSPAIQSPPSREDLEEWRRGQIPPVSAVVRSLLGKISEVYEVIGSYHQRTIFEAHPELSFYQLNEQRALRYAKHTQAGRLERRELLEGRVPGADTAIATPVKGAKPAQILDCLAMLSTARRIRSRGITRLPQDPEWDSQGLRMELLY